MAIPKDHTLQASNAALKLLVRELTAQNLKLQKQIAKCQAQCISDKNRIIALEAEVKKRPNLSEILANLEDSPSNSS